MQLAIFGMNCAFMDGTVCFPQPIKVGAFLLNFGVLVDSVRIEKGHFEKFCSYWPIRECQGPSLANELQESAQNCRQHQKQKCLPSLGIEPLTVTHPSTEPARCCLTSKNTKKSRKTGPQLSVALDRYLKVLVGTLNQLLFNSTGNEAWRGRSPKRWLGAQPSAFLHLATEDALRKLVF